MATIGFIGLGNMGGPMAANLVKAGHKVNGFDVVEAARTAASAHGVTLAASNAEAAREADVVITMLPGGKEVIDVYEGDGGILAAARPGTLLIDSSTIDIASMRRSPAASAAPRLRRSLSWWAARRRLSHVANRSWRRWGRKSSIAGLPGRVRQRKSAII